MSGTEYINQAQKLVQTFSEINSTEELVIFVAETNGMLAFCQELIDQYDRNTRPPLIQEVLARCAAKGVLPGALIAEIRKVLLALNRYHDASQDHYAVLGLKSKASVEEIKKAYRNLSKEYHPDSKLHPADNSKRFMEISGAYQALMVGLGKQKTEGDIPWRKKTRQRSTKSSRQDRQFFLILIMVLIALLSGFSIFLAARYNRKAAISQLPRYTMAQRNENPATASRTQEDALEAPVEKCDAAHETQYGIVAPETKTPLVSPPPRDGQAEQNQAEPRTAGNHPGQLAGNPQSPPVPGQETEPAGNTAEVLPSATVATYPATVPATSFPAKEVREKKPRPAAVDQKLAKVTAVWNKPTINQADSPPAEEIKEVPPAGTGLPNKQENTNKINNSATINTIISHYEHYYNNRELASFMGLFAEDATENGHPVATLSNQYRNLFEHTRTINMQIHDTNWNAYHAGFQIRGKFNANYTYNDGRTKAHKGDIMFHLIDDHGELKIKTLDYVFLE